jgi:hypothetical protein
VRTFKSRKQIVKARAFQHRGDANKLMSLYPDRIKFGDGWGILVIDGSKKLYLRNILVDIDGELFPMKADVFFRLYER